MWFKNLYLFRLAKPFSHNLDELDDRLARLPFRSCGPLEMGSMGFVPPLGKTGVQLVQATAGRLMVCLRSEEKLLPASVVKEVVGERVAEIEEEQVRKVGRKERDRIKDEVLQDLLPRAFTRSRTTFAYVDPAAGWLIVDTASRKRAEELTVAMRKCLDSLEILPPQVNVAPPLMMTRWLQGEDLSTAFIVEEQCELREPAEQGSQVRLARQDLGADEVRAHLLAGKQVVKLALSYGDRLSFVLDSTLQIRRLRFLDVVQDEADAAGGGDGGAAERFDADFALMALEIARLLPDVLDAFGGEAPLGKGQI